MEFRRINDLPPYVFTIIDSLKIAARQSGEDVIDLGFGNPDLSSPEVAVDKLCEAAHNARNHRYSSSRGIPKLRQAVSELYLRRFGVELEPDLEVINTIGAKEGFSHLMWVLLQPGDAALVPSPSYPIHIYGPLFAGADIREVPLGTGVDFFDSLTEVATNNPDTSFTIVDSVIDLPNVASLTFAEEQGSFLVGAAAALKSQTGTIGFIGGVENDLIKKFEAGYAAGASAVNPDIDILVNYITQPPNFDGFNDPARGKEIATSQYEAGADVIYSAAGGSGLGAFEAAVDAGAPGEVWAIGVDSDQYNLVSEELQPYILTSMLKKVDVATFDTIDAFCGGSFAAGVQTFDLSVDGVDYSTTGGFVDDIADQLDEYKAQIVAGEIEVPTTP